MAQIIRGGALWTASEPTVTYEEYDPNDLKGWTKVEENESYIRLERDLGDGRVLCKTLHKNTHRLLARNQRLLNENAGKRWGDGQVIGSVPLNLYFQSGLPEANKQGDRKYIQRWWDDPDHQKFRTFKGSI